MDSRLWVSAFLCVSAAGAAPRPDFELLRDVEYVRYGDRPLALDAAIPRGGAPAPAIIVVHGGGWVRGDRRLDVEPLLEPLAAAGLAWFSISYRPVDDATRFGAPIDDVKAAIRFVRAHAAAFHVDPDRIGLVGESAGGQLAAMAALDPSPDLRVRAVVALYTPTDLVALARTSPYVPQWIRDNIRGTAWESLLVARLGELSPIEHVRRDMPPFLLIHGTADKLVPFEQSRAMCDRMRAAGARCELYPVEGAGHGVRWWESSAAAQAYKREMVRWLKERLS